MADMDGEYPFKNSEATKLLSAALEKASEERKLTQREVARSLGYKSVVVVSHMASGRAPIPIDRADDLARVLRLDRGAFLLAVLDQRFPHIDFKGVLSKSLKLKPSQVSDRKGSMVANELADLAGSELDDLPNDVLNVLRSVVTDRNAARRWITPSEVPLIEHLRKHKPEGLSPAELSKVKEFIAQL